MRQRDYFQTNALYEVIQTNCMKFQAVDLEI